MVNEVEREKDNVAVIERDVTLFGTNKQMVAPEGRGMNIM
jgi:hypothetical protein